MCAIVDIFIPGEPKGQPRPRAFSVGGSARVYDPSTAEGWKSQIAQAIEPYLPERPLEGPVRVELVFHMPRPKAHYRTGKYAGQLKSSAPEYHTGRPDVDNLIKSSFDALSEIGFWRDDSQVCLTSIVKQYANGRPGCRLVIERIDQGAVVQGGIKF